MLVERGLQTMNVELISDAYDIASNYLQKSGAIPTKWTIDDALLEAIVQIYDRGDRNKIRLANKAIVRFENARRDLINC